MIDPERIGSIIGEALLAGARVNEAAAAAGYRHLESFSKAFKQQYHVCPRQVRSMA